MASSSLESVEERGQAVPWRRFGLFLIAADGVAILLAFLLATLAVKLVYGVLPPVVLPALENHGPAFSRASQVSALGALFCSWLWAQGQYSRRLPLYVEFQQIVVAAGALALVDAYLQLVVTGRPSRLWVIATWVVVAALTLIFRIAAKNVLDRIGAWRCPTLVVGSRQHVIALTEVLHQDAYLGYDPTAAVEIDGSGDTWTRIVRHLEKGHIRYVMIGVDNSQFAETLEIARLTDEHFYIPSGLVLSLSGLSVGDLELYRFLGNDFLILNNRRHSRSRVRLAGKRAFDLAVASVAVVLLSPLLLALALVVSFDGGPAFYASERIGRHGRPFRALKFRSMVPNAAQVLRQLLESDPAAQLEWSGQFKLKRDPRITWIGGFLRRTSLDELPQLFNVLRGEMSLVGPRPLLPEERDRYESGPFALYCRSTPGLTGMWQVSGRDDLEYCRRAELNAWYVRNWSPWLDLFVLAKTALVVCRRAGAS